MEEIFLLTHEFVRKTETKEIAMEYDFSSSTLCNWWMFVSEIIFDYVKQTSQKIGGAEKVIEIDVYELGNNLVLEGLERETKKLILVPIPNGTEENI
ncbi:hypothetical protein TNCV_4340421 [Trichonephila clavipes]|nr:hypothetical protein TNCV_4340421 [Trichonephila clavipes]